MVILLSSWLGLAAASWSLGLLAASVPSKARDPGSIWWVYSLLTCILLYASVLTWFWPLFTQFGAFLVVVFVVELSVAVASFVYRGKVSTTWIIHLQLIVSRPMLNVLGWHGIIQCMGCVVGYYSSQNRQWWSFDNCFYPPSSYVPTEWFPLFVLQVMMPEFYTVQGAWL